LNFVPNPGELESVNRGGQFAPNEEDITMRLLHTMLRVNDLDESLAFYCDKLGMKLLRKKDYPSGEFTLAFVGYGSEDDNAVVELTYNWGVHKYEPGNAFGHLAIGVEDIYKTCGELKAKGVKVVREPGPMKHGGAVIAFIEDPSGYRIELIERKPPAA
jgi:lactoylglutathione lyase